LKEYYTELKDTEVDVTAVALHPQLRLTKIKQLWADGADDGWICRIRQQLHDLWQQHKIMPLLEQSQQEAKNDILEQILNSTQFLPKRIHLGPWLTWYEAGPTAAAGRDGRVYKTQLIYPSRVRVI
jgi:cytochrome oxidase assembly protein ShyY1